jgi:hypothetical protein
VFVSLKLREKERTGERCVRNVRRTQRDHLELENIIEAPKLKVNCGTNDEELSIYDEVFKSENNGMLRVQRGDKNALVRRELERVSEVEGVWRQLLSVREC